MILRRTNREDTHHQAEQARDQDQTTYGEPSNKTTITKPNKQQNKQEIDDDVEGREDILKLKEKSYAKFDLSSAGARAKSAGPPGPPGMVVDGCVRPLPPSWQKGCRGQLTEKRGDQSTSPPPPPPKRKPPPLPPPLSDMPATMKQRAVARLEPREKASLTRGWRRRRPP